MSWPMDYRYPTYKGKSLFVRGPSCIISVQLWSLIAHCVAAARDELVHISYLKVA